MKKYKILPVLCAVLFVVIFCPAINVNAAYQEIGVGQTYNEFISLPMIWCNGENTIYGTEVEGPSDTYLASIYISHGSMIADLVTEYSFPFSNVPGSSVSFDVNYDSILFKCYFSISPIIAMSEHSFTSCSHRIEEIYIVGYGQEYPVSFNSYSDGFVDLQINQEFKKGNGPQYVENPSQFVLKIKSRIVANYLDTADVPATSAGIYPGFNFSYGLYKRIFTFVDVDSSEAIYVKNILSALGRIENIDSNIYKELIAVWQNQEDLEKWLSNALSIINAQHTEENAELDRIYAELRSIHKDLIESSSTDKNKTDAFADNSNAQSSALNELNQQNDMEKIDIDSASGTVDDYIDANAISNYGVVLSTFTGNSKILQMLLITLSIGVVSYVLFGKR